MSLLITANQTVKDNQWWREIFRIHARIGEYFEIHCWSDELKELRLAEEFGQSACFSIPDMKIVHGTVTERFVSYLLHSSKPIDCQCYNKMVPFYTIRIGNHFSSEKYGTEVILQSKSAMEKEKIAYILSAVGEGVSAFYNK